MIDIDIYWWEILFAILSSLVIATILFTPFVILWNRWRSKKQDELLSRETYIENISNFLQKPYETPALGTYR